MLSRRAALALLVAIPFTAEAQRTSTALCGETSPAASRAASRAASPVPIRVPIVLVNNHVHVEVCAAGRTLNFILDTGAGASFFDLGVANELGIARRGAFRGSGAGAGTVEGARLDTMRVHVGETSLLVRAALDFAGVSLGEGAPVQGILGHDFIARWVVAIDYDAGELILYDPETFSYSGAGAIIPIDSFDRNHPHVRAEIVVGGKTIDMKAIVDVGASTALALTKPFVDKHQLRTRVSPTIRTSIGGGVGGPVIADVGRVDALRVGRYSFNRPVTQLFGDSAGVFSGNLWDANIGGEVLRRFRVFFDYGRRQMILEPGRELTRPFEGDMSGLRIRAQRRLDSLIVAHVMPGTPADEAGIRSGDVVVAVDGKPVTSSTLRELRPRLRRLGESVSLSILRGTERAEARLATRRLI